jgi:hypothetical protein
MRVDAKRKAFYATLESVPPVPCDFSIGDQVTFTNEYGVSFSGNTVVGFSKEPFHGRFIHLDNDCYWFPKAPESLKKES